MKIKMIPLTALVPSPANVRKTGTMNGIEELAASIEAHGLLQNLQVRETASGKFEVVAGGRRLAALKLLAKRKALAKDAPIGCNVLSGEDATEISLAENEMRQAMHPADQFEAFKALIDAGHGIEDIAARFGVTPTVVRQRLKLAAVSPKLMALYREAGMTLDQLMAFTVVGRSRGAGSGMVRGAATGSAAPKRSGRRSPPRMCEADDRRARFVTVAAYVGGRRRRHHRPVSHRERGLSHRSRVARPAGERKAGTRSRGRAAGRLEVGRDHARSRRFDALRRFRGGEGQGAAASAETGQGPRQGGTRSRQACATATSLTTTRSNASTRSMRRSTRCPNPPYMERPAEGAGRGHRQHRS